MRLSAAIARCSKRSKIFATDIAIRGRANMDKIRNESSAAFVQRQYRHLTSNFALTFSKIHI